MEGVGSGMVIVRVNLDVFTQFFVTGSHHRFWVSDGVPPGSKLMAVMPDSQKGSYRLLFMHPDLPKVRKGEEVPEKLVEVTTLPVSDAEKGKDGRK